LASPRGGCGAHIAYAMLRSSPPLGLAKPTISVDVTACVEQLATSLRWSRRGPSGNITSFVANGRRATSLRWLRRGPSGNITSFVANGYLATSLRSLRTATWQHHFARCEWQPGNITSLVANGNLATSLRSLRTATWQHHFARCEWLAGNFALLVVGGGNWEAIA